MNETIANAEVVEIVPVPGLQPGMIPTMLLAKITRKREAMKGKCLRQVSPSSPLHMSSRINSTRNSMALTKRPWGTRLLDCLLLKANISTSMMTTATANQNEYCVKPTVSRLPAIGVDLKLETSSLTSPLRLSSGFTYASFPSLALWAACAAFQALTASTAQKSRKVKTIAQPKVKTSVPAST